MINVILFSLTVFEIISPPKRRFGCTNFLCFRRRTDYALLKNDEDINESLKPSHSEKTIKDTAQELGKVAMDMVDSVQKLEVISEQEKEERLLNLQKLHLKRSRTLELFKDYLTFEIFPIEAYLKLVNDEEYFKTVERLSKYIKIILEHIINALLKEERYYVIIGYNNSCQNLEKMIKRIMEALIKKKNAKNYATVEQREYELKIALEDITETIAEIMEFYKYQRHKTKYGEVEDEELDHIVMKVKAEPRVVKNNFLITIHDPEALLKAYERLYPDDSRNRFKNAVKAYVQFQNLKSDERKEKYEDEIIEIYNKLGDMLLQYFEKSEVQYAHFIDPSQCVNIIKESDRNFCFDLMLILANDGIGDMATVLNELAKSA